MKYIPVRRALYGVQVEVPQSTVNNNIYGVDSLRYSSTTSYGATDATANGASPPRAPTVRYYLSRYGATTDCERIIPTNVLEKRISSRSLWPVACRVLAARRSNNNIYVNATYDRQKPAPYYGTHLYIKV